MNDVDLEERLRRTYRTVADHTIVSLDREALTGGSHRGEAVDGGSHLAVRPSGASGAMDPFAESAGTRASTGETAGLAAGPPPAGAGSDLALVRPAGRRRTTVLAMAAALVVLVAAAAAVAVRTDRTHDVATGGDAGRWEELPPAPIDSWAAGSVWTGTEVIMFGGYSDRPLRAAAAYDPAGRSWRRLADLPEQVPGAGHGVWTGSEVIAFGTEAPGVAAAYDPEADAWRLLTDPAIPSLAIESFALWTGDKVLLTGFHAPGEAERAGTLGSGAALYDPATGRWQALPNAPQPLSPSSDAVWTGRELIVVGLEPPGLGDGGDGGDGGQMVAPDAMTALALDPAAGTWRVLPAPPLSIREVPLVTWTGSELVVVGGGQPAIEHDPDGTGLGDGAAYDPVTGTWTPYPAPPVTVGGNDVAAMPVFATVGRQVVAFATDDPDRRPLVLDTATRTWRLGAPPPASFPDRTTRTALATGHDVLVLTTSESSEDRSVTAFTFTPPQP